MYMWLHRALTLWMCCHFDIHSVEAVVMPAVLSALCMICLMLRVGSALSSCTPSVSTLDLGCYIQWTCSDLNSSTTFTVQKKTQGEEWQDVSECFQISSNFCDVSQAFSLFEVYNMIRVGVNYGYGEIQWTPTQSCDPTRDTNARFSPPSVSVSLEKSRLLVQLEFPCAPIVACQSEEEEYDEEEEASLSCCPLTKILALNTTVTLYNNHNAADTQTHIKVFRESPVTLHFIRPTAGQEYCVVAQFASSPISDPQCFHVQSLGSLESLKFAALSGVFIALLLIAACVLWRRWASSDTKLPKSLMSLQNIDQENPFVGESGKASLEEEENSVVVVSIIPRSHLSALSEAEFSSSCSRSLEDRYYTSPILQLDSSDEHGYGGSNLETDGAPSQDGYPGHLWSSDVAHRTSPSCSLEASLSLCLGDSDIPLSSVRVAGARSEEMELDHLPGVLTHMNAGNKSPTVAGSDHRE